MYHSLFVYGTLMFPEIREALLHKKVNSRKAVLWDYAAHCIQYGQYVSEYPFLKPEPGNRIYGQIIYPLNGQDIDLIKYYEGSEYELRTITVQVHDSNEKIQTFMPKNQEKMEYGPEWEMTTFSRGYLEKYLNNVIPQLLRDYNM